MIGDLISGGLGVGLQAYGAYQSYQIGQKISSEQANITSAQIQEEQLKAQAMRLQARRSQMEVVRNNQKARSLALAGAVAGGGQFGSGVMGGVGEAQGISGNNLLGINQNLAIGNSLAGLNMSIDQSQGNIAQLQGQLATAQGISGAGKSVQGMSGQLGWFDTGASKAGNWLTTPWG